MLPQAAAYIRTQGIIEAPHTQNGGFVPLLLLPGVPHATKGTSPMLVTIYMSRTLIHVLHYYLHKLSVLRHTPVRFSSVQTHSEETRDRTLCLHEIHTFRIMQRFKARLTLSLRKFLLLLCVVKEDSSHSSSNSA